MTPVERRLRLAEILLQLSMGLVTRSVVFQEPIRESKTTTKEETDNW